jgi:hypothetical protein
MQVPLQISFPYVALRDAFRAATGKLQAYERERTASRRARAT